MDGKTEKHLSTRFKSPWGYHGRAFISYNICAFFPTLPLSTQTYFWGITRAEIIETKNTNIFIILFLIFSKILRFCKNKCVSIRLQIFILIDFKLSICSFWICFWSSELFSEASGWIISNPSNYAIIRLILV